MVELRVTTESDLDQVVALAVALVDYDVSIGQVRPRRWSGDSRPFYKHNGLEAINILMLKRLAEADAPASRAKHEAAIFLISGPMAAGKSTVARALASRFERGVYLEGDMFRRSMASGREEMTPDPSPEADMPKITDHVKATWDNRDSSATFMRVLRHEATATSTQNL